MKIFNKINITYSQIDTFSSIDGNFKKHGFKKRNYKINISEIIDILIEEDYCNYVSNRINIDKIDNLNTSIDSMSTDFKIIDQYSLVRDHDIIDYDIQQKLEIFFKFPIKAKLLTFILYKIDRNYIKHTNFIQGDCKKYFLHLLEKNV